MSIFFRRRLRLISLALVLGTLPVARLRAGPPAGQAVLWTEGVVRGQWFPFGQGMEDSVALPDGNGLRLIVDWKKTTYGVGARFAADPKSASAKPLPKLGSFHRFAVEARCEGDAQAKLTVELFVQQPERTFRANDNLARALTASWQKFEFNLPGDFSNLDADGLAKADGIRLLFLNPDKAGSGSVEFRNATLLP